MDKILNMHSSDENSDLVVSFATFLPRMRKSEIFQFMDRMTRQNCSIKCRLVANMWIKDYE